MLAAIEALLSVYRARSFPDLPPLHGGVMGFLGYDVIREVERLPERAARRPRAARRRDERHRLAGRVRPLAPARLPDRERAHARPVSPTELDDAYDAARRRSRRRVDDLARPLPYVPVEPPVASDALPDVRSSMPDGMYQQAVEVAKEYILDGDIFQVVLAQRYDIELDADPFDVYRVLRQVNPSPYMYFLRHPEITIVGSSPEPMVQLLGRKMISRPIAGTRTARHAPTSTTAGWPAELIEHPKERAEHVMLVDLARNDVGRVAQFGTVHVDELMTLERYSHVMHLTSQVSGDLRRRARPDRRAAGDAAGRHGERGAEGAGDGDHRRARTGQARPVRGCRRLRRLDRQPRHGDRDPHDVRPARAAT